MDPVIIPKEDMVKALVLPCCGLLVADFYAYCPKCGKKIDRAECEKREVPYYAVDLFDYATWTCSCGRGSEKLEHSYCPVCGRKRD